MSVASRNPFALLDDEPSAPAAPAPAKKDSAPAPAAPAKKSNAPRGGKYPSRGGGRPRDSAPADEPAEDGARRKFDGEGRGRGRGGRGRGERGGRGRGGPRGERLDRHSATGKTDTEKKVSQGWGADEGAAELNAEVSGAADAADDAWGAPAAAAEGEADPWATPAAAAEGAAAPAEAGEAKADDRRRRERTPEEEDNTVSYEEYLAQKAAAAEAEQHALRPANDGADDWTSSVQELKKSDEDAFFVGKQKAAPKAKAKKDDKVFLEIDARFERPQRGGFGGRGRGEGRGRGRGEGRGGRGRGEGRGRGSAPRQAAPTFDDQTAFPSLS
ncbi:unnamed protein product [Peniophora sp. CBMAI 1063]|nr:unnamed protein product [Peniophora sp. CBMAI 1063]